MKSQLILFSFLTIAITISLSTSVAGGGHHHDEWKPIHDLKEEHVKKIAEFAVKEHNKEEKEHLKLEEVVKGEYKKARRHKSKYRLVLAAKDEKKEKSIEEEHKKDSKHYAAVVVEKSKNDQHRLHLISFKPVK
ncbi:cystatin family protein [Tripterygium wilfordii]|uniref:Cystatin family protein n=1 Tax=Tripterygium wilfordii TaxID=458696 RepID=A0A7J7D744_TRIWF|nr:cysteine proteinase inhibitor 1-like [Tripterygium wilfordii]KAF5742133.1 cystatin family protein [Tripterygium wilfordii]